MRVRGPTIMQFNIREAKDSFSRLVAVAERGEDVILARNGRPVAKIVRYDAPKVNPPGAWKGKIKVSPDWDSPETNAEIARLFEEPVIREGKPVA